MELEQLIKQIQTGELPTEEARQRLNELLTQAGSKTEDIGFAKVDTGRADRTGFPEVIFGETKSAEQITAIFGKLMAHGDRVLATRVSPDKADAVQSALPGVAYHPQARALTWFSKPILRTYDGHVAVVCAGTSDLPVAEEAAVTAECMGSHVERVYDVGISGIHRLFAALPVIQAANAIVVAAGMDGSLPSVIGGLVSKPIIAVPTSVGYGASLGGMAALLSMLNSCMPGITTVNIDNGFSAGYYAALINKNRADQP